MGLGITVAGTISILAVFFVVTIIPSSSDNVVDLQEARSALSTVNNEIAKTTLSISDVVAASDSSLVNFTLNNLSNTKLWDYDTFDVMIVYDADISSTKTRITEKLSYDGESSFLGSGQNSCDFNGAFEIKEWIIGGIGSDILDPRIINENEGAVVCTKLSHPVYSGGTVMINFSPNGKNVLVSTVAS